MKSFSITGTIFAQRIKRVCSHFPHRWICLLFALSVFVGGASTLFLDTPPVQAAAHVSHVPASQSQQSLHLQAVKQCPDNDPKNCITIPTTGPCAGANVTKQGCPLYDPCQDPTRLQNKPFALQCLQQQQSSDWTNPFPAGPTIHNRSIQNPLANNSPLLFYTDLNNTINQPQVQSLWQVSLWFVDLFLAFTLVLGGITIMLGGSLFRKSKVIESLPGILLALVAAHASMVFMSVFLNLNNVISIDFFTYANSNLYAAPSTTKVQITCLGQGMTLYDTSTTYDCGFSDNTTTHVSLGWNDIHGKNPAVSNCNFRASYNSGNYLGTTWVCDYLKPNFQITPPNLDLDTIQIPDMLGNLSKALSLMLTVTGLMLIAQVIVRLFYLDLYIVLAPIGIAAWALPGRAGQALTRSWFQGFLATVFVQFIQVVAIIITQLLLGTLQTYLSSPTGGGIVNGVLNTSDLTQIINVAFLWFIFRVPSLLNAAPMRGMMEVGQTMTQAASSMISMQIQQRQQQQAAVIGGIETGVGVAASVGMAFLM